MKSGPPCATSQPSSVGVSRLRNTVKVTKADIRRVANQTFNENNRTVGINETVKSASPAASQGGAK